MNEADALEIVQYAIWTVIIASAPAVVVAMLVGVLIAFFQALTQIQEITLSRDVGFAIGIVAILCVLFLPIPAFLIDIGLAFSIALSVLILMVALWIQRPLDFSSFPTILLIATMLRLSLNIATTRVILSHGNEGTQCRRLRHRRLLEAW
jgi:flagellar biosynthesis component FlhA